ncbi:MAG: hypothetical protein H6850_02205 [Alphaproteobacteria bacterium]|nr:MAG: hypothetical protein H6850_02205 [Alphaproteobacteria bacterium]
MIFYLTLNASTAPEAATPVVTQTPDKRSDDSSDDDVYLAADSRGSSTSGNSTHTALQLSHRSGERDRKVDNDDYSDLDDATAEELSPRTLNLIGEKIFPIKDVQREYAEVKTELRCLIACNASLKLDEINPLLEEISQQPTPVMLVQNLRKLLEYFVKAKVAAPKLAKLLELLESD